MATKGKDKILEGQIAFEFFGDIEQTIKPKKQKSIEVNKKNKATIKFRKKYVNVKPNHIKVNRKVRRS